MVFIKDYILEKLARGETVTSIAKELQLSKAMVGQYKLDKGFKPSLPVAILVYQRDGIALHPFSAESLQFELEKIM